MPEAAYEKGRKWETYVDLIFSSILLKCKCSLDVIIYGIDDNPGSPALVWMVSYEGGYCVQESLPPSWLTTKNPILNVVSFQLYLR